MAKDDLQSMLSEKLQTKSQLQLKTLAEREPLRNENTLTPANKLSKLTSCEEEALGSLLTENALSNADVVRDLGTLTTITEEVKSINTQAIILHGERIKKAQAVFKNYQEGTFSRWLTQTYGNRQTPYNFLQYYDFYQSLTLTLREKLVDMPKQAIYTLASRKGDLGQKRPFIEKYSGETKEELLNQIRKIFPLDQSDGRRENLSSTVCTTLKRLIGQIEKKQWSPSEKEKGEINKLLMKVVSYVQE